ncbi:MAG: hypothetical protein UZ18_ATM001002446, partial [Armatimonadetes bacterium OLB18]
MVFMLPDALENLTGRAIPDVGVGRGEVRPNLRAVDALPPEGVVRELVELVPTDLLRQEVLDAELNEDLRQRGGVSEHVGKPHIDRRDSQLFAKVLSTVKELPHQGLPAGQVAVGFDPHGPNRLPSALSGRVADALEELGVFGFDPLVLRGLRMHENVVGVLLDQRELVGGGMRHLLLSDVDRPEPSGVEVGVPHRRQGVPVLAGEACESLLQRFATLRKRRPILKIDVVDGGVERAEQGVIGGLVFVEGAQEIERELHVVGEGLDLPIDRHQPGALNGLDFRLPGQLAQMNAALGVPGVNLNEGLERLASLPLDSDGLFEGVPDGKHVVFDVEAAVRRAVFPHRPLAAHLRHQSNLPAREPLGSRPPNAEPNRAVRRPVAEPGVDPLPGPGSGSFFVGVRFRAELDVEGLSVGPNSRLQFVGHELGDPANRKAGVLEHGAEVAEFTPRDFPRTNRREGPSIISTKVIGYLMSSVRDALLLQARPEFYGPLLCALYLRGASRGYAPSKSAWPGVAQVLLGAEGEAREAAKRLRAFGSRGEALLLEDESLLAWARGVWGSGSAMTVADPEYPEAWLFR